MNDLRWEKTDWGWQMETTNGRWQAQVYLDPPLAWRVFNGETNLVAGGEADTPDVARRRAKAVLFALCPVRSVLVEAE